MNKEVEYNAHGRGAGPEFSQPLLFKLSKCCAPRYLDPWGTKAPLKLRVPKNKYIFHYLLEILIYCDFVSRY